MWRISLGRNNQAKVTTVGRQAADINYAWWSVSVSARMAARMTNVQL